MNIQFSWLNVTDLYTKRDVLFLEAAESSKTLGLVDIC